MMRYKTLMELMMKKIFSVFLALIILAAFGGVAGAEERVVQLTVPGCAA